MNRFAVLAAASGLALCAALAQGQVIETFDSPNLLQKPTVNPATTPPFRYHQINDGGSFNTATYGYNATNYQIISSVGGYGTGYHNIFTDDLPPVGAPFTNGVVDISGSSYLQLDITINSGTVGPFVDLQDGAGNFYKYFFGYGLVGTGNAPPQQPGETITAGALPNELILRVPLATPYADINGTGTFDFSQVTLFRLEDDPGPAAPYDISFNDLRAVNVPEPVSLSIASVGSLLLARRRRVV